MHRSVVGPSTKSVWNAFPAFSTLCLPPSAGTDVIASLLMFPSYITRTPSVTDIPE